MTPTTEHFTPLELLLIQRLKQLRSAAAEFLDAEADHGGFFHPEKLSRKRAARLALENELPRSGDVEPKWNKKSDGKYLQTTADGDIIWANAGPAA